MIGEFGIFINVYKVSMIVMMVGLDFIKIFIGKEIVNVIFLVVIVMLWVIRDFFWKIGNKIGFKLVGGICSVKDFFVWFFFVKEEFGDEWLKLEFF